LPTLNRLPSNVTVADPLTRVAPPQEHVLPGPEAKMLMPPVGVGWPLTPAAVPVMTPLPAMLIAGGLMTALKFAGCITTILIEVDVADRSSESPL
jgi:hypothetical protein